MYLSKDIIKEGNQILREISSKVTLPLSMDDLNCAKQLYEYVVVSAIDELVEKYQIRPGVGIAAPQVGVNKRMFAINATDFLDEKQTKYLNNLHNNLRQRTLESALCDAKLFAKNFAEKMWEVWNKFLQENS